MLAPMKFRPTLPGTPAPTLVEFSPRSKALLAGVDPRLAELMTAVEAQHPDAFEISEGMRSKERQADMVAQGKSQTYNSKHLTGNAVDISMIGPDGKPNWDFEAYRPIAETAKATAARLGIPDFVWGGDWKTLKDGVHFQVGGKGVAPSSAPTPAAPALAGTGGGAAGNGQVAARTDQTWRDRIRALYEGTGSSSPLEQMALAQMMEPQQQAAPTAQFTPRQGYQAPEDPIARAYRLLNSVRQA